jgi:hypothetical protein
MGLLGMKVNDGNVAHAQRTACSEAIECEAASSTECTLTFASITSTVPSSANRSAGSI